MGMFDEFMFERNGKQIRVQTKKLDCTLCYFNLGDYVQNYQDKNTYVLTDYHHPNSDDQQPNYHDKDYYGFIIINNIFIDWVYIGKTDYDQIAIDLLNSYLVKPELLKLQLIEIIKLKNSELQNANNIVSKMTNLLMSYRWYQSGSTNPLFFGMSDTLTKLKNNTPIEKLMAEILEMEL